MIGVVINYRRGRHTTQANQVIVKFKDISDRNSASKLIGKRVLWVTPGKKFFIGKITAPHGNSGSVRVRFSVGLPGQIIGDSVYLLENPEKIQELIKKVKDAKDINQVRKILNESLN